jgi:transposase-like protein
MDQEQKTLMEVNGVNASAGALEGARRATGEAPAEAVRLPDPEVVAQAKRRRFSASYKRRILREAAACSAPGEIGALLRREGLYSSHLTHWRREIEAQETSALGPKRRGPKPDAARAEARRTEVLERDLTRLRQKLDRAEQIIEVQKKLCDLLGLPTAEERVR